MNEDYDKLKAAMATRFSELKHPELHKTELRLVKRGNNEKLNLQTESVSWPAWLTRISTRFSVMNYAEINFWMHWEIVNSVLKSVNSDRHP